MATTTNLSLAEKLAKLKEEEARLLTLLKEEEEANELASFKDTCLLALDNTKATVKEAKDKEAIKTIFVSMFAELFGKQSTTKRTKVRNGFSFSSVCVDCFNNGLTKDESIAKLSSIFTEKPLESIKKDLQWHVTDKGYVLDSVTNRYISK